jgi:thioesterase domain-containing protein
MPEFDNPQEDGLYQIEIMGNLDNEWSSWFSGLDISNIDGDHLTILTGHITDQARLRGILNKIWDLNLMVISVNRIKN